MQCGLVSQAPEKCLHLRKDAFWFIAQAEERFRATESLTLTDHFQDFFRKHRMRSRFVRIATKSAIAAVVAAQIGKWNKNFARIGDDGRLKLVLEGNGRVEKSRQ
jgi:hypothetical protein